MLAHVLIIDIRVKITIFAQILKIHTGEFISYWQRGI